MNVETCIVILIGILSILFFWKVYTDYKNEKKRKPVIPPSPVNFENDVIFMHFMIDHKIKQVKSFKLGPARLASSAMITETEYTGYINEIIEGVMDSFSDNYLRTLMKYFTQESLVVYITELVMSEMTITSVDTNLKQLNKKK
jgi:hypothetical protein